MKRVFSFVAIIMLSLFMFVGCNNTNENDVCSVKQLSCFYAKENKTLTGVLEVHIKDDIYAYNPTYSYFFNLYGGKGRCSTSILGDTFGCTQNKQELIFLPKGDIIYVRFSYSNENFDIKNLQIKCILSFEIYDVQHAGIVDNSTHLYNNPKTVTSPEFTIGF